MGSLRPTLQLLDITGNDATHFPLAVTQLRALTCLKAGGNEFKELPAAVTALSRLMDLTFGRVVSEEDPLQLRDVRLKITCRGVFSGHYLEDVLLAANGQAPYQKFKAALDTCEL